MLLFSLCFCRIAYGQIILQEPINNQELITSTPFFDWTDVSNINRFYIKIVELGSETNPIIALNNHPSVHQNIIYGSSSYYYPVIATPLEPCKEYAWIVYTISNENRNNHDLGDLTSHIQYISIPSVFKIACNEFVPNISIKKPFIELQQDVNLFIHEVPDDTLRIKFKVPYNLESIKYKIVSSSGAQIQGSDSLSIVYGLNYLSIKLESAVSTAQPYSIYIENGKGNTLQGRFRRKE